MCRAGKAAGATLIELIVTIVVISVALTGVLIGINTIVSRSADPMVLTQSRAIAEAYLEEILPKDYAEPGSTNRDDDCSAESGESRADYDDVGDYGSLPQPQSPPRDQNDQAMSGLDAYQVTVSVDCAPTLGPGGGQNVEVKVVTVTVEHTALNSPVTITGYRSDI